jgi:uncharacterized membrane protein YGL010W
MKSINTWLEQYGESHQNPTNKIVHWICVPAIFFSLVGLIWEIPFPWQEFTIWGFHPNWAVIMLLLVFVYYLTLSIPIAIGMFLFGGACLALLNVIDHSQQGNFPIWILSIVVFTVAWIGQFWGHSVEGKKPSFFKDLQFLMIGPAWLISFIYQRLGIKY